MVKGLTRRQAKGYLNAIMDIEKLFGRGGGSGSTGQRESMTDEECVQESMRYGLPEIKLPEEGD